MPRGAKPPDALVDTSVAIPLLVADHKHHEATVSAVGQRRIGLAGHAAFETFSVLTRLPAPLRRSPEMLAELMKESFPDNCYLSAGASAKLLERLPEAAISGGNVFDALVGATAAEQNVTLLTRDRRALATYRALNVAVEVVTDDPSRPRS
ncbi:MAG TPA: type II toxin-antitoxin system VapC family toxin [Chloroflexota bacterium]|nr:type II toxin-antitoxin system VapC family toxin [Chloroflexota bacterium]